MLRKIPLSKLILDKRSKPDKNGYFPLALQLIHKGRKKCYRIGYKLTPENWEKIFSKKARGKLKETAVAVFAIESESNRYLGVYQYLASRNSNCSYMAINIVMAQFIACLMNTSID